MSVKSVIDIVLTLIIFECFLLAMKIQVLTKRKQSTYRSTSSAGVKSCVLFDLGEWGRSTQDFHKKINKRTGVLIDSYQILQT